MRCNEWMEFNMGSNMASNDLPLTNNQLLDWHENGYLIVPNILTQKEIKHLLHEVDHIIEAQEAESELKNTAKVHGKDYYNIHNPFDYTSALDYLLDHPKTFDIVTYMMGPYIQAMSCHVFVRRPCDAKKTNIGKFHTDSGPSFQRILPTKDNLPLQIKVQFFLTDIEDDNASNFIAVPGSHLRRVTYHHPYCLIPECNQYLERGEFPPDAKQLKVKAGDILIHGLTLWHAVAPNHTKNTRRSISIRYGQMWFKEYYSNITDAIRKRMTPRQRRLLGDFGENPRGDIAYRPPEDQVVMMLGDNAEKFGWSTAEPIETEHY